VRPAVPFGDIVGRHIPRAIETSADVDFDAADGDRANLCELPVRGTNDAQQELVVLEHRSSNPSRLVELIGVADDM
jgi:hypothetical protein